jgi:hypothetical protein
MNIFTTRDTSSAMPHASQPRTIISRIENKIRQGKVNRSRQYKSATFEETDAFKYLITLRRAVNRREIFS